MPAKRPCKIFVSATGQNDGKTTVSLGLIYAFRERSKEVGFIKPIGQRYLIEQNEKIDEDSVLIEKVCDMDSSLKDMSPIAVERGFTQEYILKSKKQKLTQKIKTAFKRVAKGKDIVVIEGTGHAGVGSVFDLCNATVAKILDSKVIIVSSGGIGRPIDEIMLNAALFKKKGVKIAGVIINKVKPKKYDKINRLVRMGLKRKGLKVLGVIPYKELLPEPTVGQILDELDFKLLNSGGCLEASVDRVLVGAMGPADALKYFSHRSLVITPGDREDIILALVNFHNSHSKEGIEIAGIVLSGGLKPSQSVIGKVKQARIPLLLAEADTYSVAAKIHDLTVKIRPQDSEKTRVIKGLIEEYVDIDLLMRQLQCA